ncbi:hypothetical protein ACN47E_004927 [Coniothyrium glycines]
MPDPIDELPSPRQAKDDFLKYLREDVFVLNFYRLHMLYFIVVIIISSVIVYGQGLASGPQEIGYAHITYMDALFLSCSAMTTTGLNSVNLGDLSRFQQAWFAILMMIGNIPFVSTAVVLIRRYLFRRKMADVIKHSHTMRRLKQDIEDNRQEDSSGSSSSGGLRQRPRRGDRQPENDDQKQRDSVPKIIPLSKRRTYHYQTGFGFIPTPWETKFARSLFGRIFDRLTSELKPEHHGYISFKPRLDAKGRFLELSEEDRMELGGVEYRALQALLLLLIAYQVFWYFIGTIFLVPYAYRDSTKTVLWNAQPGELNPGWWGFFSTVTEFANGGLHILNDNFIPFSGNAYVLLVSGLLAFAGQTQFPIFLRFTIWTLKKMCPKGSRVRNTLDFLLQHPRRCFIYLFPSRETWYLFAIQVVIDITAWLCFIILNLGIPDVDALSTGTLILDGLFQATGLRTSGAYIISFSSLAPACLVVYLVIMYISSYPLVLTLRKTNTYEERSIGLDHNDTSAAGVASHLQKQLAYDIWFQFFSFFLICVIERGHITRGDPGFDTFSILFEVTSAYGTVGLSTGVPEKSYSLSGSFASLSKVVMLFVMIRGRHRGLPLAIDRSILLPGEELMRRMDEEFNSRGNHTAGEADDVVDNIRVSEERSLSSGDGAQSPREGRPGLSNAVRAEIGK